MAGNLRNSAIADERTDGLGNAIIPEAEYYVQDSRQPVGNCISWWRPNGAGYCCDLTDAGIYLGERVAAMRATDVPWPVDHVRKNIVVHVRGDLPAMYRTNYKPGPR